MVCWKNRQFQGRKQSSCSSGVMRRAQCLKGQYVWMLFHVKSKVCLSQHEMCFAIWMDSSYFLYSLLTCRESSTAQKLS